MIFDDSFRTFHYLYPEEEHPSFWNEFDLDDSLYSVTLDDNFQASLDEEWLNPSKLD